MNSIRKYPSLWVLCVFIVLVLFFVCEDSCGQDADIKIRDFSGGWNSKFSYFGVQPNQCTRAEGLDFWSAPPGVRKRLGYVARTDTLVGGTGNPAYALFSIVWRDNIKTLLAVTDQRGPDTSLVGLAYLVASDNFGYSIDFIGGSADSIYPYVYPGVAISGTAAKGRFILSSGRQRPLVAFRFNNKVVAKLLVPIAPGEPLVVPMNSSASEAWGNPDGEYRYAITASSQCGATLDTNNTVDSSIEAWTGDVPDNWEFYCDTLNSGDSMGMTQSNLNAHSGTYCVELTSYNGAITKTFGIKQRVDVDTGTYYSARCYAGYYDTASGASGWFTFSVNGHNVETITPVDEGYWHELEVIFKTTSSEDSITIVAYMFSETDSGVTVVVDDITVRPMTGATSYEGYVTQPVKAIDGMIMHTNFTFNALSQTCADTGAAGYNDITLNIYRTAAYPGKITILDTFFFVAQFANLTDSMLDTLHFVDSIPDDSLRNGSYAESHVYDNTRRGRAADTSLTGVRVGAPTYLRRNDTGDVSADPARFCLPIYTDTTGGDTVKVDSTLQFTAYAMILFDTASKIESDTGRNCFIYYDAADSNYVISLPPIPSGVTNTIRVLYKGIGTLFPNDSAWGNIVLRYDTIEVRTYVGYSLQHGGTGWIPNGQYLYENADRRTSIKVSRQGDIGRGRTGDIYYFRYFAINDIEVPRYSLDTTILAFYPVAYIRDSSVKQFIDTTEWALISQQTPYTRTIAPVDLDGIIYINDRAWGFSGRTVYYSYLDSGGYWSPLSNIGLNLDDGSDVVIIWPFRDHIKIFKGRSQFIIYDGPGGEFVRRWVIDGFGCIAARTMVGYNNGLIYLSEHGIIYETGLIYKDRGSSFEIISLQIQDIIEAWTPTELETMVAVVKNNEYIISIPGKDTVLVYDFIGKGWSFSPIAFYYAVFHDTLNKQVSAKDMLFIKDDDSRIFQADTTGKVLGVNPAVYWKSGALAISPRKKDIAVIGFYVEPNDIDSAFGMIIYNSQNVAVDSFTVTPDAVYYEVSLSPMVLGSWFYVEIYQPGGASISSFPDLNGIDIYLRDGYKEPSD